MAWLMPKWLKYFLSPVPIPLHLHVTESILGLTLRSLARKNALDRILIEIEMNLNEGGAVQILSLLIEKKKKKMLLFFFNEIWKKRTHLSLFYSYLLVEVTKRISSNNNICKC